jgi:hypothetical protein
VETVTLCCCRADPKRLAKELPPGTGFNVIIQPTAMHSEKGTAAHVFIVLEMLCLLSHVTWNVLRVEILLWMKYSSFTQLKPSKFEETT